jgi:hypothetical protein
MERTPGATLPGCGHSANIPLTLQHAFSGGDDLATITSAMPYVLAQHLSRLVAVLSTQKLNAA